jgi:hypothetical protein
VTRARCRYSVKGKDFSRQVRYSPPDRNNSTGILQNSRLAAACARSFLHVISIGS